MMAGQLEGSRFVVQRGHAGYPTQLETIPRPPEVLYVIGHLSALEPGLAVIGARKATPYGRGCARRFSRIAAGKGAVVISGGARGCDSEAHRGALDVGGRTVVVLGGGCDELYPQENAGLFQQVIDRGGAVVSEYDWTMPALPFQFRERNRIIAGLAAAVLIVEAGLPSGTFSTADEALEASRDVLVVPGAITSPTSSGSNRLLFQGARPVIDDQTFEEALFDSCGFLVHPDARDVDVAELHPVLEAIRAEPLSIDEAFLLAARYFGEGQAQQRLMELLVEAEAKGLVARYPNGRWGPVVASRQGPSC